MFRWQPPCWDPAWQSELDRLAPRTDRGPAWLKLVWLAGENWLPAFHVQRFAVVQMFEPWCVPPMVLADLRGANPRNHGHWDNVRQRFVSSYNGTINREQWQWFQETGCYGRVYWIVQGPAGGHRRRWDDLESGLAKTVAGEAQPPAMGELPYQPFSMRVIERLREHDRLLRYRYADPVRLTSVDRAQRDHERALRAQLFDTMTDQVQETLTFTHQQRQAVRSSWRRVASTAEPGPNEVVDLDQLRENFVEAAA